MPEAKPTAAGAPSSAATASSKAVTVGLAQEEARHGVRVVGVSPGPVDTRRIHSVFETEARLQGVSVAVARERWLNSLSVSRAVVTIEG